MVNPVPNHIKLLLDLWPEAMLGDTGEIGADLIYDKMWSFIVQSSSSYQSLGWVFKLLTFYKFAVCVYIHTNNMAAGMPERFGSNWKILNTAMRGQWDFIKYNTLRLKQNGHHLPDNIFKSILLKENI